MEAFKVGDVITNNSESEEWTVVEVTQSLIAVRARSSGMKIDWYEKGQVTGQIAAGVWKMK